MSRTPVAAWLDSYRQELRRTLRSAAEDGFSLVTPNAAGEELNPRQWSRSARRHLARHLVGLGLRFDAIAAWFSGLGLGDPRLADERLDRLAGTLELCADLGVAQAVASVSGFADEQSRPMAEEMLRAVADLADQRRIHVAVHPGKDDPALTARHVRLVNCPYLGVVLDSSIVLPGPHTTEQFAEAVGAVHVRDVRRPGERVEEVALGQGEVDFPKLLRLLDECGYRGALTVRRDAQNAGIDAMRQGREYIASLLDVVSAQ